MKHFPNGFTSWYETHHEVVTWFTLQCNNTGSIPEQIMANAGTGCAYEFCEWVTDEFEKLNKDREWDGEFFDEIEDYLNSIKEYSGISIINHVL